MQFHGTREYTPSDGGKIHVCSPCTTSEAGYTDIRECKDDGISGTVMHRPGLDSMLEAVRNGEIQTIYVKDLSRLSRNRLQVELLRDEFSESGRQRHCTYRQRRLYQ
ncbi:MAG: recombinase family protein [Clostridia bacterium]|nr:recombinase family protein [Clostridia bacterium]